MYLNRVLVTSDLSQESTLAFPLAKHISATSKSEITLINIVEGFKLVFPRPEGLMLDPVYVESVEREVIEQAKTKLADLGRRFFPGMNPSGVTLRSYVAPSQAISDYAKENHFGLIIAATQGKNALERVLIGSTAEGLIRRSHCPVLAVPVHNCAELFESGFKHILVTTDFSNDSEEAFKYAAYEAKKSGAKITVGHTLGEYITPELLGESPGEVWKGAESQQFKNEYLRELSTALGRYVNEHFPLAVAETAIIKRKFSIANSLTEFALEERCDLIVISTHGAGLGAGLIGGVAEKVVRHASCPVLIVPKKNRRA